MALFGVDRFPSCAALRGVGTVRSCRILHNFLAARGRVRPEPNDGSVSYHLVMSVGGPDTLKTLDTLDTVVSPAFTAQDTARFRAAGWWSDSTLSDAVRRNATQSPDRAAYVDHPGMPLT